MDTIILASYVIPVLVASIVAFPMVKEKLLHAHHGSQIKGGSLEHHGTDPIEKQHHDAISSRKEKKSSAWIDYLSKGGFGL
jgi:hypothetical protein